VIVTTSGTATDRRELFNTENETNETNCYFLFERVLMDEATMIKEAHSVVPLKNCNQLVLIGDQKQLGPTYDYNFEGKQSLFCRLMANPKSKSHREILKT
jgi:superfamily I DNA and/or RNA helicase